ncbi:MAG: PHP domain-containing protein, partial [Chloroflexia bacterium]|nr:PHP domain-containing protein [Chloroflexia bacterium]
MRSTSMHEYAELHCHSYHSMLDGASSPAVLVERALELGMSHLALTDHDGLYGAVRFHTAALARGLHPIIGLEVGLETGHHLTLLARNNAGYRSLCQLVSRAQLRGEKHAPVFALADLPLHADGLIALSGCRQGEVAARILQGDHAAARAAARNLAGLYGEGNYWIELQDHLLPDSHGLCTE